MSFSRILSFPYLTAFGAGVLTTLALPPLGLTPVLWLTFPVLLWLLDETKTSRQAFLRGWLFGWGYFIISLYWISFSLFTDISRFWWALPFSAGGLPFVLAFFPGLTAWIMYRSNLKGFARILLFATVWTATEWLRGHMFTGFPWNLIAYSWDRVLPILQITAFVGIYGLSFITVLLASLPALTRWPSVSLKKKWFYLGAGITCLLLLFSGGTYRLYSARNPTPTVEGVRLRLVQAAIPETLKWDSAQQIKNFEEHLVLSAAATPQPVTHIIWSESAVPWPLNEHPELREAMARIIPTNGILLTGALRTQENGNEKNIFNSLLAVDTKGNIAASYDKFHLVPFGEYLPFRNWLNVTPIAAGTLDFGQGPGPQTLSVPGLPSFSPLVCYEAIFPGAVAAKNPRPQWLLNVTNDAWFGRSAGPHQHFAIARVRAIEEGVPLVRVANTGISGVIDPYGRVTATLTLGQKGFLDASLPKALEQPTFYAQWKDWPLILFIMGALLLYFLLAKKKIPVEL